MTATLDGTNGLSFDVGQPIQNISAINSGYLYGNRVINGAMEIDQVNSGGIVANNNSTAYGVDMFGVYATVSSKLTFQQVADAPAGLKNSTKFTVTSQYSPAATDYFLFTTSIEGKDVIDFQFGTNGATTIILSHWIKGSVAGTYSVSLRNTTANRSYVGTIAVTTSWAQVKITLQGDLTGTWATDNTAGLSILWDLGCGTNFNTTAGSWQAGSFYRTSGSVTFVNQVAGSTLNITGVDCRLGSVAPTYFERRANELQLAQRYYEVIGTTPSSCQISGIATAASQEIDTYFKFSILKRSTPTITFVGSWTSSNIAAQPVVAASANGVDGFSGAVTSLAAGRCFAINDTSAKYITASARLF